MSKLIGWYFRGLEVLMVLCLAAMCVMVFGNVVLRHRVNTGINVSEELSRFSFIWLTFLGAVVATREGTHLGMDLLLRRLPPQAARAALVLGQLLMLLCCAVLLWGMVRQHPINAANIGLVTGVPLSLVYGVAYLCAVSIGAMALCNVVRLCRGRPMAFGSSPHLEE